MTRHRLDGPAGGDGVSTAGFTLVELLVALFVFAMLSAAATALLGFGVDASTRTNEHLDGLAAVSRSRSLLTTDLGQAAARTWRDETGARFPAFAGNGSPGSSGMILRFVRRGWRNDGGAARSSLQRVEYRLANDRLERLSWPLVDGAAANPPAVLMTGVTRVGLRYYSRGTWLADWEPEGADALPDAVEVTLDSATMPALRQLFLVAPGE